MMNKALPLVTIAIPTYNRANAYLKQAIDYAVNQTYPNIEIIISDNCSTDNTEALVGDFNDLRIRYFKQVKNIGANNNFNFCLKQARGTFFVFLLDDDSIDNDFIETCLKAADYSADTGIIRTGMRRIDSDGKVLREEPNTAGGLSTEDFFIYWFEGKTPMHLCMTMFNTDRLRQVGGLNSKHQLFQDVLAEVRLAAKFGRVDIKDVKASYRMHYDQYSYSVKIKEWCEDSFLLFDTICNLVPENKALLREKGKLFFFRHNYNLAKRYKSPVDRFTSYLVVFREFGYLYSLSLLFYSSRFFRKIRRLKEKIT